MAANKPLRQLRVWNEAIAGAAEPANVRHFLDRLSATPLAGGLRAASARQARILAALFGGSPVMSEALAAHPEWLATSLNPQRLRHPRGEPGLREEVGAWLPVALAAGDYTGAFTRLRQFKQREMLRIAARDLARLGDARQIAHEISNVADVCLDGVLQLCQHQLVARLGRPWHRDATGGWHPTQFCVLGLGKLGGQELNYSSDVDVIFVYREEGTVGRDPPHTSSGAEAGPASHVFFRRLAEAFIAEVGRLAPEGMLYRIDLRLRPQGGDGPLARSLVSYGKYYSQWGRTWERMMLMKARWVAGDAGLAAEFLEMIQPFRYPRSIGEGVLREISAMKERIENEAVKAGELDRDVKLGRGGIREIEFVAQTLQLIHAGRVPLLQGAGTLPALQELAQHALLPAEQARLLAEAYCFLRDVEHRLQMEHNLQTHTIPSEQGARERLARLMGFARYPEFEAVRDRHSRHVRQAYDALLKGGSPVAAETLPRRFQGAEAEWRRLLAEHSFKEVDASFRLLGEFANGPGYVHVSTRTAELARQLIAKFFALCPKAGAAGSGKARRLSDPDRVLTRVDSFIDAHGARGKLFETWISHPEIFELLLLLFDRSEFLAESAIRAPCLVDELVLGDRLRPGKTSNAMLEELRDGRAGADQRLWLRRYHQAEFMRIGLRDILEIADFEQILAELNALADACLQYALEGVLRKHGLKSTPFVIIGLGKLGGQELDYGSDLDLIFVAGDGTSSEQIARLQRVAAEVMEMLSRSTELGVAFVTDARLRPDGDKGPLVSTLASHEAYYRRRAGLWEIQALTRTRPVAGDMQVGAQFQQLAGILTNFSHAPQGLAAYTPTWREEIKHMRRRIEKERTPAGQGALAIKTGAGGLVDAEFLAQIFCLGHGWQEANTLRALVRARDAKVLAPAAGDRLIENYRQLRRVEGILRRWSFEGETLLPDDPAPLYRVAVRCGWNTAAEFIRAIENNRRAIREAYRQVLGESDG